MYFKDLLNEDQENRHILEERGKVELCEDVDEEKKFSAVIGSGRYADPNSNNKDAKKDSKENDNKLKLSSGPPRFINKKKAQEVGNNNNENPLPKNQKNETLEKEKEKLGLEKKEQDHKKHEENEKTQQIKSPTKDPKQNTEKIEEKAPQNKEIKNLKNQVVESQSSVEKILEGNINEDPLKKNESEASDVGGTSSLSLKNKKFSEKSLKLNSICFFGGNKEKANNPITDFQPENQTSENTNEVSVKSNPEEVVTNNSNLNAPTQIFEKVVPSDQFKLSDGDKHLSMKYSNN